ncbi:MAG TPA: hypothetical protein VFT36_12790 [Methylomirabilota bacterium]|nr:hypothetical protein [Methylomirabilota bacterium]
MKRSPADALQDVAPREFVSARKALVARLAREGKTAEARRVARLRRPSPVVWALNRAAAARPRELRALIDSVDRLRRAQLGQGDLRTATADYRTAFDPLARAAADMLREAGTGVSGAVDRRIRSTLQAAVTDKRLRGELAAGRLSGELADPGFAVLTGGPVPAEFLRARPAKGKASACGRTSPRDGASHPSPLRGEGRVTGGTRAEARRLARQQARATRDAARRARALERKARQAEQTAVRAERRVEAMRRALAALEQRSAALRAAADEARKARVEHGKLRAGERSET